MILAIDVGNTNIIIGVIDAKKTYFVERITTTIGKPNLEYAVALKSILEIYHIAPEQLDGAIVSSVVPPLNRTILAAIRKITGLNAMLVGSGMKTGLNILMDNPKSVGSDMIVNAVGALAEHEPPIIIIEMGTATTMSVIDKNGRYVGGAILPGLRVSLDSMSASTAASRAGTHRLCPLMAAPPVFVHSSYSVCEKQRENTQEIFLNCHCEERSDAAMTVALNDQTPGAFPAG